VFEGDQQSVKDNEVYQSDTNVNDPGAKRGQCIYKGVRAGERLSCKLYIVF
jgi:hypothetical protein